MANTKTEILQLLCFSVYTEIKDKGLAISQWCVQHSSIPRGRVTVLRWGQAIYVKYLV